MKNKMSLTFDVTISDLVTLNHSFSKGMVQIAYHGRNRNKSDISKETFEKALPSLKNIPIVGRYVSECEDFGSHDMSISQNADGDMELINATVPFGVVPEGAQQCWTVVTEDDGTEHEYLCTECIFWTRQFGYKTIEKKKKCHQSMEVSINQYHTDKDGYCVITDMEWEALCILGDNVEPCFESANVQIYSQCKKPYMQQFSQMIQELKELHNADDSKGGKNMPTNENVLEPNVEPVEPNSALEGANVKESPEAPIATENPTTSSEPTNEPPVFSLDKSTYNTDKFYVVYALSHDDIRSQIYDVLYNSADMDAYFYIDEVFDDYFDYVFEICDEYGCKRKTYRQEYEIEDNFVKFKGDKTELFIEKMTESEKSVLDSLRAVNDALNQENLKLKEFKTDIESKQLQAQREDILARWSSAIGAENDMFKSIQENAASYSLEDLEKNLKIAYADSKASFSFDPHVPKSNGFTSVKITDNSADSDDGYGGLFKKYGYEA